MKIVFSFPFSPLFPSLCSYFCFLTHLFSFLIHALGLFSSFSDAWFSFFVPFFISFFYFLSTPYPTHRSLLHPHPSPSFISSNSPLPPLILLPPLLLLLLLFTFFFFFYLTQSISSPPLPPPSFLSPPQRW